VKAALLAAAERGGATVLGCHMHAYLPQGVSGVLIIAESHITLHTWPEHSFAAADVFTCGDTLDIEAAGDVLKSSLGADRVLVSGDFSRGDRLPTETEADGPTPASWKDLLERGEAWALEASVDLHGCDPACLGDLDALRRFSADAGKLLGMAPIGEPAIAREEVRASKARPTLAQRYDDARVSIHAAEQTSSAYVDVLSSRYFEPRTMAELAVRALGADHYHLHVAVRR